MPARAWDREGTLERDAGREGPGRLGARARRRAPRATGTAVGASAPRLSGPEARGEHIARVSDVLGALAAAAEARGSLDVAIRYTRRQVALAPLAEPPNRELIRRLALAGDRASALAVYAELAERFRRELQTVP